MKVFKMLYLARRNVFRVIPLMRDPQVPGFLKVATVALGLLIVSPVDIFGDIPVLGMLDDGVLLMLLLGWFVSQATRRSATPAPAYARVVPRLALPD